MLRKIGVRPLQFVNEFQHVLSANRPSVDELECVAMSLMLSSRQLPCNETLRGQLRDTSIDAVFAASASPRPRHLILKYASK